MSKVLVVLCTLFIFVLVHIHATIIEVESSSSCIFPPCNKYRSILDAVNYIKTNSIPSPVITVQGGLYQGIGSKDIIIDFPVQIKGFKAGYPGVYPTIDCEGVGQAFSIIGSPMISISQITFVNCTSKNGGAIYAENSNLILTNTTFNANRANFGGALYLKNSKANIKSSGLTRNIALEQGGAIFSEKSSVQLAVGTTLNCNQRVTSPTTFKRDDVVSSSSSMVNFDPATGISGLALTCLDESSITNSTGPSPSQRTSACQNTVAQCPTFFNTAPVDVLPPSVCGNNICELQSENCLNCPSDCNSCYYKGVKAQYFSCLFDNQTGSCPTEYDPIIGNTIDNILKGVDGPVSGKVLGYFRVPTTGTYQFRFDSKNMGINVKISKRLQIDSQFFSTSTSTFSAYLIAGNTNTFELSFKSFTKDSEGSRDIAWFMKSERDQDWVPFDTLFYSLNTCGDGVLDPNEQCVADAVFVDLPAGSNSTCGDGLCQELDPNTCIQDCHQYLAPVCSPRNVRKGSIAPGARLSMDTLGFLINNQYVWHLPGINHLMFGVNVIDMGAAKMPLFHFGYCTEEDKLIEDVYRNSFYQVPEEVEVVPLPQCSFVVQSSSFKSVSEYQKSMSEKVSNSASVSAGGRFGKIGGEASASYSNEKSVAATNSLNSERTGSVIESSVQCSTSHVRLRKFPFHPNFVKAISKLNSTSEFIEFIGQYGTHFYVEATLGGKLKQITTTSSSTDTSFSSKQQSEMTAYSFSMSVSAPVFSASASFSGSTSTNVETTAMNSFSQQTSRTSVITYGGAPGSYGPASDSAPSSFGSWAATTDLLPVPVDFQLLPIRGIIPEEWETPGGEKIYQLWAEAESNIYISSLVTIISPDRIPTVGRLFSEVNTVVNHTVPYSPVFFERKDPPSQESFQLFNNNGGLLKFGCGSPINNPPTLPAICSVNASEPVCSEPLPPYVPIYNCALDNQLKFNFGYSYARRNIPYELSMSDEYKTQFNQMNGLFVFFDVRTSQYTFSRYAGGYFYSLYPETVIFMSPWNRNVRGNILLTNDYFLPFEVTDEQKGRTIVLPTNRIIRNFNLEVRFDPFSLFNYSDSNDHRYIHPLGIVALSKCIVKDTQFLFGWFPWYRFWSYECESGVNMYKEVVLRPILFQQFFFHYIYDPEPKFTLFNAWSVDFYPEQQARGKLNFEQELLAPKEYYFSKTN